MNWRQEFLDTGEQLSVLRGKNRAGLRRLVESALGIERVRAIFDAAGGGDDLEQFFTRLIGIMRFHVEASGFDERLPRSGPVVVVSNHPYGGIDALVLAELCQTRRADTRVLGNAELKKVPAMRPWLFFVKILGEEGATRSNAAAMRDCLRHLRKGGVLAVFPAGAVSHWHRGSGITDPAWSPHIARMIAKSGAPVLPVGFSSRNRWWYQMAGALHPMIRTALLPRAFLAEFDRPIRCNAGKIIPPEAVSGSPEETLETIRNAVYELVRPSDTTVAH